MLNAQWNVAEAVEPGRADSINLVDRIHDMTGALPQIQLMYEENFALLWIVMRPEPKPVFTLPLVDSVRKVQRALAQLLDGDDCPPLSFLAFRTAGPVFSLGGDLDFYLECLANNDRAGLEEYAQVASDVIVGNYTGLGGRVTTIAAVHARALGGGIDPARACHIMIAEESASFCYPEVNYNHFPIAAVPVLARRAGRLEAERILLSGATFSAEEFRQRGVVDEVVPDGGSAAWVRKYAKDTAASRRARISISLAFNAMSADLESQLAASSALWVEHMLSLEIPEVSKLKRIVTAQERMLARL
ncbi:crotonase/enoyl-CoA hydratase family protein [Consotaella aegiceratis]|uniref:crotonase/enoyl-CoA hydratase family protein n=1 Tax=Consotaella aegiceratis TaxID=3097961 RepID=UPI002F42C3BD